jgi:hypothetical protein
MPSGALSLNLSMKRLGFLGNPVAVLIQRRVRLDVEDRPALFSLPGAGAGAPHRRRFPFRCRPRPGLVIPPGYPQSAFRLWSDIHVSPRVGTEKQTDGGHSLKQARRQDVALCA